MPFRVKEPYAVRVPYPFPYPVEKETKPTEPTKPPRPLPPPVIHLPPNIIHNFIPQPEHKFLAINRRPLIQHFYPRPKPEPKPRPEPEPDPEPEPEPEPHHEPEAEPDKEIDEESDMALLAKVEAMRAQSHVSSFSRGFGGQVMPGMRPPIIPLDAAACLMRGLAPGSAFVPGMGYLSGGQVPHPFQGMNTGQRPPTVFNHLMTASFPGANGYPSQPGFAQGMGLPMFPPGSGIPVSSLPSVSPDFASFSNWQQQQPGQQQASVGGERGGKCHKICHQ